MTSVSFLNPLASGATALTSSHSGTGGKIEPNNASATRPTGDASSPSTSGASQTSLSSLGSTFLKLLTQELQNQDPTAPMDSTQMVGQMISLNQLDQLASINQLLTTQFTAPSSSSTAPTTQING